MGIYNVSRHVVVIIASLRSSLTEVNLFAIVPDLWSEIPFGQDEVDFGLLILVASRALDL